jgi:hypothetical protein
MAWEKTGGVATLLEWDGNIPSFEVCLQELHKAKDYWNSASDGKSLVQQEELDHEEVSTPIEFLIAPIMEEISPSE